MAHELLIENGQASMFYVGNVPWHSHGVRLVRPPTTAAEAIKAAHLDWEVVKVPLYISGVGRLIPMPDKFGIVRRDRLDRDDCPVFGLVGRDYVPLQNLAAFRFFDPLLEGGHVSFETAGALGKGERVWVLARLKGDVKIGPDDLQRYILLANRHDGSGSVLVKFTPVRVVCQNTLAAAFADEGRSFRVRHDGRLGERLLEASSLVEKVIQTYEELQLGFESMREVVLTDALLASYLERVFPTPTNSPPERITTIHQHRLFAAHLYRHGAGNQQESVQGTLWAAYNGVTDYIDHRKPNRQANDFSDSRVRYVWFGSGATTKQRALVHALRIADPKCLERLALMQ